MHIYWNWAKPTDLDKVAVGLAMCNASVARKELTTDRRQATCQMCKDRYDSKINSEEGKMIMKAADEKTMEQRPKVLEEAMQTFDPGWTGPQIAAKYNEIADMKGLPRVKKFRTLEQARLRLRAIMAVPRSDESAVKKVKKEVKTKVAKEKKPRKGSLDLEEIITVIEPEAYANINTGCAKRFKKMLIEKPRTVKDFLEKKIGSAGDLKWWRDDKKCIKLGKA